MSMSIIEAEGEGYFLGQLPLIARIFIICIALVPLILYIYYRLLKVKAKPTPLTKPSKLIRLYMFIVRYSKIM